VEKQAPVAIRERTLPVPVYTVTGLAQESS
jgi:hypothetical protein